MAPTMMEKIVVRVVVMVDDSLSDGDDNNVTEQSPLLVGSRSGSFRGGGQEDWDVIVLLKPVSCHQLGKTDCQKIVRRKIFDLTFYFPQTSPTRGLAALGSSTSVKTSPRANRHRATHHNLAQTKVPSALRNLLLFIRYMP